jgi:hypothetical protein
MLQEPAAIIPRNEKQEAAPTFEYEGLEVAVTGASTLVNKKPDTGEWTLAHPIKNTTKINDKAKCLISFCIAINLPFIFLLFSLSFYSISRQIIRLIINPTIC